MTIRPVERDRCTCKLLFSRMTRKEPTRGCTVDEFFDASYLGGIGGGPEAEYRHVFVLVGRTSVRMSG